MVLRFITIIFLFLSYLKSDNFLISYQADVLDSILLSENLLISPAIIKRVGKIKDRFKIPIINENILKNLYENKDILIEKLFFYGLRIQSYENMQNYRIKSQQRLSFPSQYISVEIQNQELIISIID